jgi:trehalose/maltose transport system substrate-binding protein
MRSRITKARLVGGAIAALLAFGCQAQGVLLRVSCGSVGQELELCRSDAEAWAARTGHRVQVVPTPNDASERLALYLQLLGAGSGRIDVLQVDVAWPGLLGDHLLDLRPHARGEEAAHFPNFIASNTRHGRLVAMPWFANAALLYYRQDLLRKHGVPVPQTWAELDAAARQVQAAERAAGHARMWGYVWQGRAYEGLTCNAFEWIASHGGGTILDDDGRVTVRNPQASQALARAASWVGTISPPAVLNYAEEESRGVFQAGDAVFMRNWPYAWSLAQHADSPVRGRVGVARLPRGGAQGLHASTLGGESLAVSRYSRHPAEAADLVMALTSAPVQKRRAIAGSFNPTRPALYQDREVQAAHPFMAEARVAFETALARPAAAAGTRYNQLSHELRNAVHDVLSRRESADEALQRLEGRLNRLGRGGRWN